MTPDLIIILVVLAGLWVWATWPITREVYTITADSLDGLGQWAARELFGDDEDSIRFHELRCERCSELIGEHRHRIIVEQNRLWWTCSYCDASNCVEIVGVQSYD
jgi:hypothetical protein